MVPLPVDERTRLRKDGVPSTFSERTHCVLHIGMSPVLKRIIGHVSVVYLSPFCTCVYFSKRFVIDENLYWRVLKLLLTINQCNK